MMPCIIIPGVVTFIWIAKRDGEAKPIQQRILTFTRIVLKAFERQPIVNSKEPMNSEPHVRASSLVYTVEAYFAGFVEVVLLRECRLV